MRALVLDSGAVSLLARSPTRTDVATVLTYLQVALEKGLPVRVPAAVLAEQYRGQGHDQAIDAFLSRYKDGVRIVNTDRDLARLVGNLLARSRRGSEDHVDATVVATAVRLGGGLIMTSDPDDITRLADGLPNIEVEFLR